MKHYRTKIKYGIGVAFILLQLLSVIYARFIPERYYCWAPYDEHTFLRTKVWVDGIELPPKQISQRYRYQVNGWEPRSVNNVFDIIEDFESTYGRDQHVQVQIRYTTNGHEEKVWTYTNTNTQ